jgi:hypothetical protein
MRNDAVDEQAPEQNEQKVARQFEIESTNKLQWKNREDWKTRGRVKGLAGMALGFAALKHVPIGGALMAIPKIMSTDDVISKLCELKKSGCSDEAAKDIDYIISKKQAKAAKAGIGIFVSTVPYAIAKKAYKKYKGTLGKHRGEVAKRLLQKVKNGDEATYRGIVLALLHEGAHAQEMLQRLKAVDEDLAVTVLMGKIASK